MSKAILEPLFELMVDAGASDLHWCDGENPRLRVHGFLQEMEVPDGIPAQNFDLLTESLVGHEGMERFEHDLEYDGSTTVVGGRRVRINVYRKDGKTAWAVRLLPNRFFELDELGLPLPLLEEITQMRQGLILITGATGSGKTTTLASIIDRINATRAEHIFTIEDPVEYVHVSKQCLVSQRSVGHDTKSFHDALRSVLREDPDVVLLGEMRDRTSMDAALTLAETGHLTFATLHTSGAAESVSRLVSAFEAMEQPQARERIAANLKVVITQQLIPWSEGGGRSLAAEIMLSTTAVAASIRDHKERQLSSLIELGSESGMKTMNASLAELIRSRKLTLADAVRYSPDREALKRMFA